MREQLVVAIVGGAVAGLTAAVVIELWKLAVVKPYRRRRFRKQRRGNLS